MPDASRSGMVAEASQEDLFQTFRKEASAREGSEKSATDSSTVTNDLGSDDLPDFYDPIVDRRLHTS